MTAASAPAPEDDSEDEEASSGRMRLGTMDDSDIFAEVEGGEQADARRHAGGHAKPGA